MFLPLVYFFLNLALSCYPAASQNSSEPYCPTGFVQFGEFCYFYNREPLSYPEATHRCENHFFGHLVSIHTIEEQKFVARHLFRTLRANQNVWLGAMQGEGSDGKPTIKWADGTPLDFVEWMTGEPNYASKDDTFLRSCLIMWSIFDNRGKWSITNCQFQFASLCKRTLVIPSFEASATSPPTADKLIVSYINLNWMFAGIIVLLVAVLGAIFYYGNFAAIKSSMGC